jgi:uncharacterized SAM-binding protein YcdF (DUF218 family)
MFGRFRRWPIRLAAAIGVFHLLLTFTPVLSWWTHWLATPWREETQTGGTLIVLAGSEVEPELLGHSSYWRSVYAVRAWRTSRYASVVLSGSASTTQSMASFLVAHGVPLDRIQRETQSASTQESGLRLRDFLKLHASPRPWVLLTSDYHVRRSYGVLQRAGLTVATHPVPDAGKRYVDRLQRWPVFQELGIETAKLFYYWWQGWI